MQTVIHHLSLIPTIGPATIQRILACLTLRNHDTSDLYRMYAADFEAMGMPTRIAEILTRGLADRQLLEREQMLMQQKGYSLLTLEDTTYPALLRAIHAPPPVLYVRGSVSAIAHPNTVAVVGSRDATAYGKEVTQHLISSLIPAGWVVISGGARGIDATAHEYTLQAQGITIAVLGSGLLRPYPHENRKLFDTIAETGGALISAYPLEAPAAPGNFPARNRIIAGIAKGCVVVQAAEKSGALITASHSLHEGREVGIVPGSIFDPRSAGCHALLAQGATPITSGNALLEMLGDRSPHVPQPALEKPQKPVSDPILLACTQGAPFDEIMAKTTLSIEQLHTRLWDLQVQGRLEQLANGNWRVTACSMA